MGRYKFQLFGLKEFLVDLWEVRKLKLYGKNTCPGPQSDSLGVRSAPSFNKPCLRDHNHHII